MIGNRLWVRRILTVAAVAMSTIGLCTTAAVAGPYDIYQYTSISNNITPDKCIDIPNGSTKNGLQVVVAQCSGSDTQSFTHELDSTGVWGKLRNVRTGKCLEILKGYPDYGIKVVQNVCDATASKQKFQFESFHIRSKVSDKCVAIDTFGPELFQWACASDTSGYYQFWTPHPADSCTAPICTDPGAVSDAARRLPSRVR